LFHGLAREIAKDYALAVSPPITKQIVCLANSRKPPSGRCVAGREYSGGEAGPWIRPVSARSGLEISEEERRYDDGTQVSVLDVLQITFLQPQPHGHQIENHVIDDGYYWSKVGQCTFKDVLPMVQRPASLWIDGHNTRHGQNDQVPQSAAAQLRNSLVLIRPRTIHLEVASESQFTGGSRRRVRAEFQHGSSHYRLVLTHPEVEQHYLAQPDGRYDISGSILCVSLADFYHGNAFKLVATVITP
jgi:hypothetical protein